MGYLLKLVLLPLVCKRVRVSIDLCPRTPPKHHRFRERRRLWRPVICTSIHLCSRPKPGRVRGAMVVVCALTTTGGTGVTSMYQAGTTRYHDYICTIIYGMRRYQRFTCRMRMNLLTRTYSLWPTCYFDFDIVCFILMSFSCGHYAVSAALLAYDTYLDTYVRCSHLFNFCLKYTIVFSYCAYYPLLYLFPS